MSGPTIRMREGDFEYKIKRVIETAKVYLNFLDDFNLDNKEATFKLLFVNISLNVVSLFNLKLNILKI